jgi:hypothetical protein
MEEDRSLFKQTPSLFCLNWAYYDFYILLILDLQEVQQGLWE